MADQLIQLERSIDDVIPHIFKRPLLHVSPSDSLLTVATFLSLGPQIYVDGLVVLDGHKAVGTIGGRNIIEYLLYHKRDWQQVTASNIMNHSISTLDKGHPLKDVLDIFGRTGFGFVPITVNQKAVTSISIRDVLRVAIESKLKMPIGEMSSSVIAIANNTSIGNALELMMEQAVRSLIVRIDGGDLIVNDRMILEYLLSYKCRQAISSNGLECLFETDVGILEPVKAALAEANTPASLAAERLLNVNTPCLLLGSDLIVTPWDIVMKGLAMQAG